MDSKNSPSTAAPNSAVNLRKRFNSLNQPRYPLKETNSNIPSPFKKQKVRLSPVGTENREPSLNSGNSKPTSRLAGDELLHWQQSWRKIMKESIVYFEGVQEYSRLQLSEYKRASKLLKLVGCEITPFYDSDVTIIVSRRSFNARKDYPSNDIFSNVSQLKIKVWDYEKVFRFLKNLGINIVTGIDESVHHNLYNLLKEEKIFGLTDRDPNAKRDDLHYFDKNYLYVYDLSQKVRPIAIREWNDSSYPVLNLTLDGKCPFISDPNDVNTERKMLRRMRKWNASQQYRDLLKKATNSMMSNIKNGIQLTTTGFSGTSTSTDKVHDEEVTIEEATSSSRKAEAEAEAAYDDKENEYNFKQPVMPISLSRNSSCIQVVSNSKVLDVAASGYNGASNAINMSMDSNSAVQGGNGLGPMTSQVPSRNLNNLKRRIIMKKQQRRSAEKEKEELTPGYCENCRIKYDHFREHINSTRHRNFASDDRNFKDIDNLIASLNESKSLGYVTSNGDYRYA
ncbi:regulator of Cdc7 kinase [Scheffersomyces stipitis CBS 6054]|uniref:Regulator of Cdc7 kinase n=1 Tax=Scheffersomyces stipitis (strain ATCC 58785 / CBS 6054 / NBRC 10063 / NRRL Y-11545) TaxID=322104 RepID=A3LY42_PICST|nr:regulator of Cdc7 kinase [Scheffersomyces stipitis CBS 6054]ABN67914.2 regulator of Cdc7 kinase [Scheffersomyces stipitis CBS 6054]